MTICLVFLSELTDETYLSVVVDVAGHVVCPLEMRTPMELYSFQSQYKMYYVFPSALVSLYHLTLPPLSGAKAKAAVTFFLENKLFQPIQTSHFVYQYDTAFKGYTIAVVEKEQLVLFLEHLKAQDLLYTGVIIASTLLKPDEMLFDGSLFLISSAAYAGAILPGFLSLYQPCLEKKMCWVEEAAVAQLPEGVKPALLEESPAIFLAKRCALHPGLDLCQGEFVKHTTRLLQARIRFWTMVLLAVWGASFFLVESVAWYQVTKRQSALEKEMYALYEPFFPQLSPSDNVRTEIEAQLKKTVNISPVWAWLKTFGQKVEHLPVQLQSIAYRRQKLTLVLHLHTLSDLEQLEQSLRSAGIKVHQVQTTEEKGQVHTTLELT